MSTNAKRWCFTGVTFLLALVILFPVINVFFTSLKPATEFFTTDFSLVPKQLTTQWYEEILYTTPIVRNIFNSFAVSFGTMLVNLVVVTMGAYALSRYTFPMKQVMCASIIFAYVFPAILLVLPLYMIIAGLGLTNNYFGLIITHTTFTIPYGIFLLRSYMDTIPKSIDESAIIDGAGAIRTFLSVIIPLSAPGIAAILTYALINSWNEYLYSSVIMTKQVMKTLPVKISEFISEMSEIRWGTVMAAACIALLPSSILFQFLQKEFINGLTAGAVKG